MIASVEKQHFFCGAERFFYQSTFLRKHRQDSSAAVFSTSRWSPNTLTSPCLMTPSAMTLPRLNSTDDVDDIYAFVSS